MTRLSPDLKLAKRLDKMARRLRRGQVGDARLIAYQLEQAAKALRREA